MLILYWSFSDIYEEVDYDKGRFIVQSGET